MGPPASSTTNGKCPACLRSHAGLGCPGLWQGESGHPQTLQLQRGDVPLEIQGRKKEGQGVVFGVGGSVGGSGTQVDGGLQDCGGSHGESPHGAAAYYDASRPSNLGRGEEAGHWS